MAIEIEAKMKLDSFEGIRKRLAEASALRIGERLETNAFFDTQDRSLLAADKGLRVRRSIDTTNAGEECTLTYKGPRAHGKLKNRSELEIGVSNFEDAIALVESLGFTRVLMFEKRRESWELGGCRVELDEVPHIGQYVEIEGPGEETVMNVRRRLGLETRPLMTASYIALLMTYLQEHNRGERIVQF